MEIPQIPVKAGTPYEMDPDDTSTYEQWKRRIDLLLMRFLEMTTADLGDVPYMAWYLERVRPIHAANMAMQEGWA